MKIALLLLVAASVFHVSQTKPRSQIRKISGRIIGGEIAFRGQFNSAAAIHVTTGDSRFFCGGSLIDQQWVLTAGQCVNNAVSFVVQLGSTKLEGDDPYRLTLSTFDYVLHPEFNPLTLENDIGLIKFRMPIDFAAYVQKAYMPYGNLTDYTDLQAIGWGQTSNSSPDLSNSLIYVTVVAISNPECKLVYGNQITDGMVCIAGEYNEGTCIGDTGAPLFHREPNDVRHVGISSFISGNGCESTDPSGFTRTYSYLEWITSVTGVVP